MPETLVLTSEGVRPFDERILRFDLEHTFRVDPEKADVFANFTRRFIERNNPDTITGDSLVLAIHRANSVALEEVGLERIFADLVEARPLQPGLESAPKPLERSNPATDVFRFTGPLAPFALATAEITAHLRPQDRQLKKLLSGLQNIAEVAVAAALRAKAEEIAAAAVQKKLVSQEQAAQLTSAITADAGPAQVRRSVKRRMGRAMEVLQETGTLDSASALNGAISQSLAADMAQVEIANIPSRFHEDEGANVEYMIVSSTERSARPDLPLGNFRYPLWCRKRVEWYDDLEAQELTYHRPYALLETDDSPRSDEVYVSYQWKMDRAADIPNSHARPLENSPDVAIYQIHLVERETTDTVLDDLVRNAKETAEEKEEDLKEKAIEKAIDLLSDIGTEFLPFPVPNGVKEQLTKLIGKAVGELVGWLIELVADLLDTSARPFPTVTIVHTIIYEPPLKPINIVAISVASTNGRALNQVTDLARWDGTKLQRDWSPDRRVRRAVRWVGASRPAGVLETRCFEQVAMSEAAAAIWRAPEQGFGVVIRLENEVKDNGLYCLALRTDMREQYVL